MSGFWSSETIKSRRKQRQELICPFDPERVKHAAYELSMGDQAYVTGKKKPKIDKPLKPKERIRIPAGQFALLLTKETIEMPADAMGFLSIRTQHKLRGLVSVSGFHVDPGYEGRLLYSVYNAGTHPIIIDQGEPVFLLWYAGLDRKTTDLYDREGRTTITAKDVTAIHGDMFSPQALAAKVAELERRTAWWRYLGRTIIGAAIVAIVGTVIVTVVSAVSALIISWFNGFEISRVPEQDQDSGETNGTLAVESVWEAAAVEEGPFVELDYSIAEAVADGQNRLAKSS